ncbi:MAG: choice-of-anchor L domain-containing protein, partial [Flavobacteriaceae bacterium]
MKFIYYISILLICCSNFMFSQQISVNNTVPLQQLIEDNFVDGCVNISNISSSVNGNAFGLPSYGYFERASSNFPFENGIVLTTGNAASAGNGVISPTLSEGSSIWGTDPDLEAALGINNTLNATSIEFDIVSTSSQFQFSYLFASEDYDGVNPCLVSDGFVFLIRETVSPAAYQNIALVPGTSDPVNTGNVHVNLGSQCPARNEQYFDGYNIGDTNYIGRTTVLTAATTILPNVSYHIKLIIADQTDGTFDSAVFIEGDSFKILDLGEDIATCAGSALLDANIQNPLASYEWFLNGGTIGGEINPTYNATQTGTYKVEVTVPLNGTDCVEEDEIIVELNTEETITPISDYELCDDSSGDGIEIFDLSTKTPELLPNIPFTNYTFSYHFSEAAARGNTGAITTPIPNPLNPQPIFVRIQDLDTNCFAYTSFNLVVNPLPNIVNPTDLEVCDSDDSPDGFAVIDLSVKDDEITAGDPNLNVTYHYNPTDASNGDNPIPTPYINTSQPTDNIYVRVVNLQTGCVNTTTLDVKITISPIVNRDTQFIDACD